MNHLTVVLLCSGNGADPTQFRPGRDDVRYRNRHDALVRCVAASLYGGASPSATTTCELIFLYDGDLACVRMSLSPATAAVDGTNGSRKPPPPPLEKDIVSSWRDAAKDALRSKQQRASSSMGNIALDGRSDRAAVKNDNAPRLITKCILDTWKTVDHCKASEGASDAIGAKSSQHGTAAVLKRLPAHVPSSKRDACSILQSTCPVDYLRRHRLNVSLELALRKFNKSKLQSIWEEYSASCSGAGSSSEDGKRGGKVNSAQATGSEGDGGKMERTFRAILSNAKASNENTIAAIMHESCDAELPCWGWDCQTRDGEEGGGAGAMTAPQHVFIVLGAVRDMTPAENDALSSACGTVGIPLVPCRLGPVPEFTSKIVSVACFHFHKGVLGSSLFELWRRQRKRTERAEGWSNSLPPPTPKDRMKRTLHTVAIVPMDGKSLTFDPNSRNRTLWCMVRLCVCSLWRSKLASSSDASSSSSAGGSLENVLTFVFTDGSHMTLNQKEFISALAEKHQAAPSERQILEELCSRRDATDNDNSCDVKDACRRVVATAVPSSGNDGHNVFALDFTCLGAEKGEVSHNIVDLAYECSVASEAAEEKEMCSEHATLVAILDIQPDSIDEEVTKKVQKIHKHFRRALDKAGVRVRRQSPILNESSQDREASLVIILQHLDYQEQIFRLLGARDGAGTEDAKTCDHKKKKKNKKRKLELT